MGMRNCLVYEPSSPSNRQAASQKILTGCTAWEVLWPYLFSTIDRGMEFMFCRMGTRRSTMAAARGLSSSGFSFTAISPAQEMITHHELQAEDGIAGP